jgi:hypothetical protein
VQALAADLEHVGGLLALVALELEGLHDDLLFDLFGDLLHRGLEREAPALFGVAEKAGANEVFTALDGSGPEDGRHFFL